MEGDRTHTKKYLWVFFAVTQTSVYRVRIGTDNPEEIYSDYLKAGLSVRYAYKDQPLPEMEIKMAKDELDEYQLKNRIKLEMMGLDVWFSTIDSNIAFKEELLKSDKDMEDAKHLRIVFADSIDEKEINKIKSVIKRLRL